MTWPTRCRSATPAVDVPELPRTVSAVLVRPVVPLSAMVANWSLEQIVKEPVSVPLNDHPAGAETGAGPSGDVSEGTG
jgi:hypothetical protein